MRHRILSRKCSLSICQDNHSLWIKSLSVFYSILKNPEKACPALRYWDPKPHKFFQIRKRDWFCNVHIEERDQSTQVLYLLQPIFNLIDDAQQHLSRNRTRFVDKKPDEIESRNLRQLVRKVKDYIQFLNLNKKYKTEFLDVGDGLAVSKKK